MTFLEAILLGLLQGITEFLPISSSGHLVFFESFLGLNVSGLKDFDIILHLGTLLAILLYFRREIFKPKTWPLLIAASVPAALAGFFLEDYIDALFRNPISVAIVMVVVGLLFFIPQKTHTARLTYPRGILIGIAQMFALIPGVSRSGSTIFTGTMLGLSREEAAKFSFMLGAIAIAGAGLLKTVDVDSSTLPTATLSAGFLTSFLSSLLAVSFLMKFLRAHSLKVFGVYRVVVGLLVLGALLI
ncbi:MAG: undecaprenyl-diphosphate phosphatase [Candidatus Gracilibacteria bacterium]|jgi:undecaprenyl-diphosphatase